ncbi:MAG: hypothetical protein A2275_09100 [Bacteroidetes bacterium RIFOXYA12_FULL_35_11]|nr:MAG: hypothetical protein A2X01_01145 [Bacteroidetes bacterium GWF2_35_48]OFY73654.1 MAG: hypothetical protein A2275_09100 [Bacteroidetes bacterium RIFOXYA12_FULL_35_11]HBX51183.1 hypothetical protein [Bacteroidales bacterium]
MSAFSQSGDKWATGGNNLSSGDFLGSKNNQPLVLKTNNTQRAVFTATGWFGLGLAAPSCMFDVEGDGRINNFNILANITVGNSLSVAKIFSPTGTVNFDGSNIITTAGIKGASLNISGTGTLNSLHIGQNATILGQISVPAIVSPSGILDFINNNIQTTGTISSGSLITGAISNTNFAGMGNGIVTFNETGVFQALEYNGDAGTVLYGNGTFGSLPPLDLIAGTGLSFDGNVLNSVWVEKDEYSLFSNTHKYYGLGTNNPQTHLHVKGITDCYVHPDLPPGPGRRSTVLRLEDEVINNMVLELNRTIWWDVTISGVQKKLLFTNSVAGEDYPVLTLKEMGNVGIGILNPEAKLHVAGNAIFDGDAAVTGNITAGIITADSLNIANTVLTSVHVSDTLKIGSGTIYLTSNSDGLEGSTNEIFTKDEALLIQSNSAMNGQNTIINALDGYVGIGIQDMNPTAKLDVEGTLRFRENGEQQNYVLTTDNMGNAKWKKNISYSVGTGLSLSGDYPNFIISSTAQNYSASDGLLLNNNNFTANFGSVAGTIAEGNHVHSQLHNQTHSITSATDHTASNWKLFYSDNNGQVQELGFGTMEQILKSNGPNSAPSWTTSPAGSVTNVQGMLPISVENNYTAPVISVATNSLNSAGVVTQGEGNPNKIWKTDGSGNPDWRDENLLTEGTGISITGNVINSVWSKANNDVYCNNSGKVGIGTETPLKKLHIKTVNDLSTADNEGGVSGSMRIENEVIGGTTSMWDIEPFGGGQGFKNRLQIGLPDQTPNISFTDDGKVAIGKTYAGVGWDLQNDVGGLTRLKLDVNGDARFTKVNDPLNYLRIGYNGVHAIMDCYGPTDDALLINWYSGKNVIVGGNPEATNTGNFITCHSTFLATDNGNVGIGVNSAIEKLEVNGAIKISNSTTHTDGSITWDGTDFMGWNNGVSIPFSGFWKKNNTNLFYETGTVTIGSIAAIESGVLSLKSGYGNWLTFGRTSNNGVWKFSNPANQNGFMLSFKDNAGQNHDGYLTITDNGYTGIGTTNPIAKLHIKGDNNLSPAMIIEGYTNSYIGWYPQGINAPRRAWTGFSYDNPVSTSFVICNEYDEGDILLIPDGTGNVGIGLWNPTYKLDVNGTIHAKRVLVNNNFADFVFYDDYKLKELKDVEAFINKNKHLPDVPSEKNILKNGLDLGEISKIQMQKIEELFLYIIEQQKQIDELKRQIENKNK